MLEEEVKPAQDSIETTLFHTYKLPPHPPSVTCPPPPAAAWKELGAHSQFRLLVQAELAAAAMHTHGGCSLTPAECLCTPPKGVPSGVHTA